MSNCKLKFVRRDSDYVVLTEHPDRIHPRDLSDTLLAHYGEKHFEISLRRNIYVIYINRKVVGDHFVSETMQSPERCVSNGENQDSTPVDEVLDLQGDLAVGSKTENYQQKLLDIKMAEEVLRKARLPKSQD